jgi:hypothetical protein
LTQERQIVFMCRANSGTCGMRQPPTVIPGGRAKHPMASYLEAV